MQSCRLTLVSGDYLANSLPIPLMVIRKYLVQIMRDEPNKAFTITELTLRIFDIEQTQGIPSEKHLDSVRKQLNAFYQRGWITRTQISRRGVYWQWKTH